MAKAVNVETTNTAWNSTAPLGEFRPYIPESANVPEFTFKAVLFGAIFGIIFGAVTVYVGLRAGLTVSASIPIAVLSISLLRAFGKASILENNIVQTAGSAGESVAAGAIFTLPALIFMGFPFEYSRIFMLALIGGWIGVLFMIPLRRQLIVQEHGNLLYPEGTACADVLVAGEKGGSFASRVFWGLGLGGAYTFLMATAQVWKQRPLYEPTWLPGASFRAEITSEYLGVGYIIGPRIAGTIFAGGVFSWLVLMPAIKFFGEGLAEPLYPSTIPVRNMTPGQLWESYIRPMGAGAVAMAGLITLMKTMPTIVNALRSGMKDIRSQQAGAEAGGRLERDIAMKWVVLGSLAIIVVMWLMLTFNPIAGARTIRVREPRRVALRGDLRVPLRHGVLAHLRADWHVGQSGERDDHRHADGDLCDVPGDGVDRAGVFRAGDHHRRRRVRRRGECRGDIAGLEDRVPDWRDAVSPAVGLDDRRHGVGVRHRRNADADELRALRVPADAAGARSSTRSERNRACVAQPCGWKRNWTIRTRKPTETRSTFSSTRSARGSCPTASTCTTPTRSRSRCSGLPASAATRPPRRKAG